MKPVIATSRCQEMGRDELAVAKVKPRTATKTALGAPYPFADIVTAGLAPPPGFKTFESS
jgi:hypothetical protein